MKPFLIISIIGFFSLTACSSKKAESCKVTIYDKPDIFKPIEEKKIIDELLPEARLLLADISIVTDTTVQLWRLPVAGDEAKEIIPNNTKWWQLWKHEESDDDIIFYYTQKPNLLQIRYGSDLKVQARKASLDIGELYQKVQSAAITQGGKPKFLLSVQMLKSNWIPKDSISYIERHIKGSLFQTVGEVVEDLLLPDFEFWYKLANLIPIKIANLLTKFTKVLQYWILGLFLIGWLLRKTISSICGFLWKVFVVKTPMGYRAGCRLGAIGFDLLVTLPSASMLALGLSGRMEDRIALEAIANTSLVHQFPIFPTNFSGYIYFFTFVLMLLLGLFVAVFHDTELFILACFEPGQQNFLYTMESSERQSMWEARYRVMLLLSQFRKYKAEMKGMEEKSLLDEGYTNEKFEEKPFSTIHSAELDNHLRGTILRRVLAVIVAPPFIGAWFLLSTFFEALWAGIGMRKWIKLDDYYTVLLPPWMRTESKETKRRDFVSSTLNAEEWRTLQFSFFWTFDLVAGADREYKKNEFEALDKELHDAVLSENLLVSEVSASIKRDIGDIVKEYKADSRNVISGLNEVADILEKKAPPQIAKHFKQTLLRLGRGIAETSGGGISKSDNVREEESRALILVARTLRLTL